MVALAKNQQAKLSFGTVQLLCWYVYSHADTKTKEIPQNDHKRICQNSQCSTQNKYSAIMNVIQKENS